MAKKTRTQIEITATDKTQKAFNSLKRNMSGADKGITTLKRSLIGLAGAAGFGLIIKNSIEQEKALAQLNARIKSTQGAAGKTAQELTKFAGSLQQITTFGDEAIIGMQSLLLTFTKIKGNTFDKATKAILDMSVAMGTDLKSSALQVGKALNDPILGVTALTRSGIQFTKSQKDMIKQLTEAGRIEEAQTIILKELSTQFGGAAEAAKNTFGGALKSVSNAFGDLLEANSMGGAITALNSLEQTLQSDSIKQGFSRITEAVITLTGVLAKSAASFANFGVSIGEFFGRLQHGSLNPLDKLNLQIKTFKERQDQIIEAGQRTGWTRQLREEFISLTKYIGEAKDKIEALKFIYGNKQSPLLKQIGLDAGTIAGTNSGLVNTKALLLDIAGIGKAAGGSLSDTIGFSDNHTLNALNTATGGMRVFNKEQERATRLSQTLGDTFSDAFENAALQGGKFKDVLKSIGDELLRMILRKNTDKLGNSFAGLVSSIGFGGFFADGGRPPLGKASIVGERGPELFIPDTAGTIIPNGIGGTTYSPTFNIDARGADEGVLTRIEQAVERGARKGYELVADDFNRAGSLYRAARG